MNWSAKRKGRLAFEIARAFAIKRKVDYSGRKPYRNEMDVLFVYAGVVDEKGTVVPLSNVPVNYSVSEKGILIGENLKNVEAGISAILIQLPADDAEVPAKVTAVADGLQSGTVDVQWEAEK